MRAGHGGGGPMPRPDRPCWTSHGKAVECPCFWHCPPGWPGRGDGDSRVAWGTWPRGVGTSVPSPCQPAGVPTAAPALAPLSAAVDEKSIAQMDSAARGCRSSRWSRSSPLDEGPAAPRREHRGLGTSPLAPGHPRTPKPCAVAGSRGSSSTGRPRGRWGPVPRLWYTCARVPLLPHTRMPCPQGWAVPGCAAGSPRCACPPACPPTCA